MNLDNLMDTPDAAPRQGRNAVLVGVGVLLSFFIFMFCSGGIDQVEAGNSWGWSFITVSFLIPAIAILTVFLFPTLIDGPTPRRWIIRKSYAVPAVYFVTYIGMLAYLWQWSQPYPTWTMPTYDQLKVATGQLSYLRYAGRGAEIGSLTLHDGTLFKFTCTPGSPTIYCYDYSDYRSRIGDAVTVKYFIVPYRYASPNVVGEITSHTSSSPLVAWRDRLPDLQSTLAARLRDKQLPNFLRIVSLGVV